MAEAPAPLLRRYAQLARFALVGAFNTVLDFVLLFVLARLLHVDTYVSNVVSTGICLAISFLLNRKWTFKAGEGARGQFVRFLVVTLVGLWGLQTLVIWGMSTLVRDHLSADLTLLVAKAVATLASLTWNYVLYSRLVFVTAPASTPSPRR